MINRSLPWNYDFKFVVEEISNINDKSQTMSISMYFGVSWLDPRLRINETAVEWREVKTGPKDVIPHVFMGLSTALFFECISLSM